MNPGIPRSAAALLVSLMACGQALTTAKDTESLVVLIAENDSKLQSKDLTWNSSWFLSAPDAPLLTFTQTLLMRDLIEGHYSDCLELSVCPQT